MSKVKQTSKRKRRSKALPVLGAAGLTLSLANSAYAVPSAPADVPTPNTWDKQDLAIGEEEIADVSLATFYVFDKESDGSLPGLQLIRHGCGGGVAAEVAVTPAAAVEVAVTLAEVAVTAVEAVAGALASGGAAAGAAAAVAPQDIGAGAMAVGSGAPIIRQLHLDAQSYFVALRTRVRGEKRLRAS